MSVSDLLDSESPAVFDTELSVGDTLVVHAPALGVGDSVDSVAETEAPCVRVETEPLAADETAVAGGGHSEPAARVVVEDLWTAYAEADSAVWDPLWQRVAGLDAPAAVDAVEHGGYAEIDETLAALDRWRTVRRRICELERAWRGHENDNRQASV